MCLKTDHRLNPACFALGTVRARRRTWSWWIPILLAATSGAPAQPDGGRHAEATGPLATKEEMIRDRFKRFEDRVFRLREQLEEAEPDNAVRLVRVLQRAGELELADRLDRIVRMLDAAPSRGDAVNAQGEWLADAERVLRVLLERDSDNEQRRDEMQRLQEYKENVERILESQRALRGVSGETALAERLRARLEEAIQRVQSLMDRQGALQAQRTPASENADAQRGLAREAADLTDDLSDLAEAPPDVDASTSSSEAARSKIGEAAGSMDAAGKAMSEAGDALPSSPSDAAAKQQDASDSLRSAKAQLKQALEQLDQDSALKAAANDQGELAEETESLADEMRDESSPSGRGPGQPGQGQPGTESLDEAGENMQDAASKLQQGDAGGAAPDQDDAIEELEQARKELEQALAQLRQEERAETLRDLEERFREMLSKQRGINEATVVLGHVEPRSFGRAERLAAADLSTRQRGLSQDAAACLNILDEDGTTIVFPRIVGQLEEDMAGVATRLAELLVRELTQQVQREIVDTLEQLLAAVERMQQENEQGKSGGAMAQGGEEQLLPTSAELKLLRSSQLRVNTRTTAIGAMRKDASAGEDDLRTIFVETARRQRELVDIATQVRERRQHP